MGTRAKFLLALWFLAGAISTRAQELRFHEYGRNDGLPGGHVFALLQDRTGWIWVGGAQGLHQFDGHTFRYWSKAQGMPGGAVHALRETADGRLWALSTEGLAYLLPGSQTFQRVDVPIAGPRYLKFALAATPDNRLLLADGTTLWILGARANQPGVEISSVAAPALLRAVVTDSQGTVWAVCGNQLCRLNTASGTGRMEPVDAGLPDEPWLALAAGPRGELALRGATSLWLRPARAPRFVSADNGLGATANENAALAFTAEGELLASDVRGLAIGRQGNGDLMWRSMGTVNGLPTSNVSAIAMDREGAAWLGMASDPNLVRWDRRAPWEVWTRRQGLDEDIIWGSARDLTGSVWAAGNGGLFRKPPGGNFTAVLAGGREYFRKPLAAPDGSIWVLVNRQLVRRVQGTSTQDYPLGDVGNRSLLLDSGGHLWTIGNRIQRSDGDITRSAVRFQPQVPLGSEVGERYNQACSDAQGRVFVAGSNGLAVYDPASSLWRRLGLADGLSERALQTVFADSSGRIWVGYESRRAPSRLYYVNGRWQADRLMVPKELERTIVVSFAEDREKNIWVGTENGIFTWNGTAWRRYGIEDGLRSEDCVASALRADVDGIWVGTGRGLAHFDDGRTLVSRLPAPGAAIAEFFQDDRSVEFSLRSLSFWRPREQLFLYRVHGKRFYGTVFDSGWVEARDPDVHYANLPGGSYSVELKTRNAEEAWSAISARQDFVVPVVWYGTAWFLTGMLVGVPLAGRWWWRWRESLRVRQEAQDRQRLDREVASRTQALNEARQQAEAANQRKNELLVGMSEQIRRPLHALNGLVELALSAAKDDKQRNYLSSAQESSASLLAMVGDVLDYAETETGRIAVRREPCDVRDCVRGVVMTLQTSSGERRRSVSWEASGGVPPLVEGDRQRLRQVLLHLGSRVLREPGSAGLLVRVELEYAAADAVVLVFGVYEPEAPAGLFAGLGPSELAGRDGLELAIAARLIDLLGGRLTAAHNADGRRAFRFSLQMPVLAGKSSDGLLRVLLAEEDMRNRRVTAALLEQAGFAVTTIVSAPDAVEQAPAADVLLIDPEAMSLDALDVTRRIRAAEAASGRPRLRIIGLSTRDDSGSLRQYQEAGMDGVLTKPVQLDDLLALLRAKEEQAQP